MNSFEPFEITCSQISIVVICHLGARMDDALLQGRFVIHWVTAVSFEEPRGQVHHTSAVSTDWKKSLSNQSVKVYDYTVICFFLYLY
jgi:hypothetical protein